MPIFRVRAFLAILAFAIFTLLYISVGIRARLPGPSVALRPSRRSSIPSRRPTSLEPPGPQADRSPDSEPGAAEFRRLAEMHEKAARECTQLRKLYENSW